MKISFPHKQRRILWLSLAGLATVLAWQAINLRSFIHGEIRPPAWDQAIHLEIAHDYRQAIRENRWADIWTLPPKPGMPPFPPLYHLLIVAAQTATGATGTTDAEAAALWLNGFYLALLAVSLFAVAWEFRGDETSLAAVMILLGAPAIQELARTQLVDLAVTSWTAAAYWAFLRSGGFSRWPGTLAFAIIHAAGMMHKWSFFSYLLPLYAYAAYVFADRELRAKVLAAGLLSCMLFAPWYITHLPVLIPRLFHASADFAVPVWKGGAFFYYFFDSATQLGPMLWLFGWAGLFVPYVYRRHKTVWVMLAWTAVSYVFWAIVPNRQFRFILPGLPALAVLACGPWPKTVIWGLAGFQVFLAANYAGGWIKPLTLHIPNLPIQCFLSEKPVREDWRIEDILRRAAELHPPDLPFSNITLVANAQRFNGPNFNWAVKALGFNQLRIRGVNRRLCEFSEFVILKRGELGPSQVISGLPEAAGIIESKNGWFLKAYEEAGRWPLPDGSEAVLFRQKRPKSPPFEQGRPWSYPRYAIESFEAEGLKIEFGPWDSNASEYRWLRVSARAAALRGLRLTNLTVDFDGAFFLPLGDRRNPLADLRFLRFKTLRVTSASLSAKDFQKFLENRTPGMKWTYIKIQEGVEAAGLFKGLSVSARVRVKLLQSPRGMSVEVTKANLGPVSLPLALYPRLARITIPFEPNPETPFSIEVPSLTLQNNVLNIP